MVRELVRAAVELPVGELLLLKHDRNGIGCAFDLLLEELVHAPILRILCCCVVPLEEQLMSLRLAQQRQLGEVLIGVFHDASQERLEVTQHPFDGVIVEQVGVVHQAALKPWSSSTKRSLDRTLPYRSRPSGARGPNLEASGLLRHILQRKEHLGEGHAAQIALGLQLLNQLLEGKVLVVVRPKRYLTRESTSLKLGSPERSVRMTNVLTKKPISSSVSARVRSRNRGAYRYPLAPNSVRARPGKRQGAP